MTFEEFAEKHEITIRDANARSTRDGGSDWPEGSHHFLLTLAVAGRAFWSGFYSVGPVHAAIWARAGATIPDHAQTEGSHVLTDHKARTAWSRMRSHPDYAGRGVVVNDEKYYDTVKARFDALAPVNVADVLESLFLDAMGSDQSFEDWCSDLGYDTDSRKALAVFHACRDTAAQLRNGLGLEVFGELMEVDGAETEDLDATQEEVRKRFESELLDGLVEMYGADDTVALDTAFNDWTDMLCKDGELSDEAYDYVTRTDD